MPRGDRARETEIFHANYAKGFASGHYPAADKRRLTTHVEVHGYFAWDVGSTPTASTIFIYWHPFLTLQFGAQQRWELSWKIDH